MKEILKSVARFVELSREFTIDGDEVYEGFSPLPAYGIYMTSSGSGSSDGGYRLVVNPPSPTKLEQYETALQEKYEKAKRYEEYLELQKNLSEYFKNLEKLK